MIISSLVIIKTSLEIATENDWEYRATLHACSNLKMYESQDCGEKIVNQNSILFSTYVKNVIYSIIIVIYLNMI
jgi:hypothetical protein